MKTEFDQKRADRDAVLYNTDGRLFDLVEAEEKLTVVSRTAVSQFEYFLFSLAVLPGVSLMWFVSPVSTWQRCLLLWITALISERIFAYEMRYFGFYTPQKWIFDRHKDTLSADKRQLTLLSQVAQVRAFKMRRRFKIAVQLNNGRELHLGFLRFGRQEHAWRQDAAQIAAFLNVPLEIPPAMPG